MSSSGGFIWHYPVIIDSWDLSIFYLAPFQFSSSVDRTESVVAGLGWLNNFHGCLSEVAGSLAGWYRVSCTLAFPDRTFGHF